MRPSDFKSSFSAFLEINGLSLSDDLRYRFSKIFELHNSWSKKINITSNNSVSDFIVENIIDPILAHQAFIHFLAIQKTKKNGTEYSSLADVGCGGGFVGFTWRLLNDGLDQLILIDGDRKKINFCKDVIRNLSLRNCVAMNSRIEDLRAPLADLVVTRATWKTNEARKLCSGIAMPGALYVHFCGHGILTNQHPKIEYTIKPKNAHRYLLLENL